MSDVLDSDDEARFRRYFICPVVGCNTVEEHDIRDRTAWKCDSKAHPPTRLRMFFADRMQP